MPAQFYPMEAIKVFNGISPAAVTSATTTASTGDALNGYDWVVGVFTVGAIAASQAGVFAIQDSADDSTYATVTGASKAYTNTGTDNTTVVIAVKRSICRAFVRVAFTTTTTDSIIAAATMLGCGAPVAPVTQTSATVLAPVIVTSL